MRIACSALLASLVSVAAAAAPSRTPPQATAAATPAPPSCSTPEYRQFDFWLGEWDVTGTDGKPAGKNRITAVAAGCALEENWTSAKGGRSTSLSVYDASVRRWHQTLVDDSGGLLLLEGEFRGGKMVLIGRRQKSRGTTIIHRITWTPLEADRVHQLWEASGNEGRSWQTVFEGTFAKRK